MENRSKWSKQTDKNLKAMGAGERTSKKVSTIRKSDGTSFRRKNANQYGSAEGGNDYTEKRVNRTDRFDLGGTADSAENGGANIGGTLGSSMMKKGGNLIGKQKNLDMNKNGKLDSEDFKIIRGKMKHGGSVKVGDKVMLPEIKMRDGKIQFEEVENGKVLSIENGIYDVLNPKTNRIHRVTLNQIKYSNGGGLANVPETFPETDAMSYKNGGSVIKGKQKLTGDDLDTYNFFIREGDTKEQAMQGVLNARKDRKKHKQNESFYKRAYEYAEGGSTKGFEYSIGGL
jgi:hypothetical protein